VGARRRAAQLGRVTGVVAGSGILGRGPFAQDRPAAVPAGTPRAVLRSAGNAADRPAAPQRRVPALVSIAVDPPEGSGRAMASVAESVPAMYSSLVMADCLEVDEKIGFRRHVALVRPGGGCSSRPERMKTPYSPRRPLRSGSRPRPRRGRRSPRSQLGKVVDERLPSRSPSSWRGGCRTHPCVRRRCTVLSGASPVQPPSPTIFSRTR